MKIRKWLPLLLTLILLIGILCGCGSNDSTLRDDDDDDDRRPSASRPKEEPTDPIDIPTDPNGSTTPDIPDDPTTPSDPVLPTNKIEMSRISGYDVYSEGLAFVRLDGNRDTTYCIKNKAKSSLH